MTNRSVSKLIDTLYIDYLQHCFEIKTNLIYERYILKIKLEWTSEVWKRIDIEIQISKMHSQKRYFFFKYDPYLKKYLWYRYRHNVIT